MINYTWVISQMDCKPKEDLMTDVVVEIHWRRNATKTFEDKIYNADVYGAYSCPLPSGEGFTPYEDLTFEQVCSWLDSGLPVDEIDLGLASQIELLVNPPLIVLPLPWSETNNI